MCACTVDGNNSVILARICICTVRNCIISAACEPLTVKCDSGIRLYLAAGLLAGALLPCMLSIGCRGHREDTLMVTTSMLLALYLGQGISAPVIARLDAAFGLVSGIFLCALCMALTSLTARFRSSTNQTVGRRGQ